MSIEQQIRTTTVKLFQFFTTHFVTVHKFTAISILVRVYKIKDLLVKKGTGINHRHGTNNSQYISKSEFWCDLIYFCCLKLKKQFYLKLYIFLKPCGRTVSAPPSQLLWFSFKSIYVTSVISKLHHLEVVQYVANKYKYKKLNIILYATVST